MYEFYVTAGPGTEKILRDELCELGFDRVRLNHGGIPFFGELEDGWRCCLQTRIGQRVMLVFDRFKAESLDDIYDRAARLNWAEFLTPLQTFACGAYVHESCGEATNIVALKLKDAIVDSQRRKFGERSNIDKDYPDVRVFIYWTMGKCTIYLDMSGDPLFKRGYRKFSGEAPLKETLAAAVLRLSGWDRQMPLVDPMCGSGTLCVEAALWAANIAPGIFRKQFGFERWGNFTEEDAKTLQDMRGEMRRMASNQLPKITGFDLDEDAISMAQGNARAAGVRTGFHRMPLRELQGDGIRRLLVTNPPYGVRLDAENALYQELGNAVRRLHGWRVAILAGSPKCINCIKLPPVETYPLKNGNIDCQLTIYEV